MEVVAMNNVLCRETDMALNECSIQSDVISMDTSMNEESYITAPMAAIVSPINTTEEELHTLFEAAISGRLLAMREQMNRISGPLAAHQQCRYETEALPVIKKQPVHMRLFNSPWQRVIVFSCLGLILAMVGFDLMGLLILAVR